MRDTLCARNKLRAASERFSNRFEHLVSGHRFIPRFSLKRTRHPGHRPIEVGFRVYACLLNQPALGSAASLHAIPRKQSSIVGPGPRPWLSGNFGMAKITAEVCFSSRQTSLSCRNCLADNHHPGGTGPPEPCESRLVQAALPSLNSLNTMQLGKLPLDARHWHSACFLPSEAFSRAMWKYLGNSS